MVGTKQTGQRERERTQPLRERERERDVTYRRRGLHYLTELDFVECRGFARIVEAQHHDAVLLALAETQELRKTLAHVAAVVGGEEGEDRRRCGEICNNTHARGAHQPRRVVSQ